ncbi:MAG TPA: hypothetical protein VER03_13075 [Bryobacteraceae bacterium]|nr:hypothetical protein [Bryobacteraceae bacterium]
MKQLALSLCAATALLAQESLYTPLQVSLTIKAIGVDNTGAIYYIGDTTAGIPRLTSKTPPAAGADGSDIFLIKTDRAGARLAGVLFAGPAEKVTDAVVSPSGEGVIAGTTGPTHAVDQTAEPVGPGVLIRFDANARGMDPIYLADIPTRVALNSAGEIYFATDKPSLSRINRAGQRLDFPTDAPVLGIGFLADGQIIAVTAGAETIYTPNGSIVRQRPVSTVLSLQDVGVDAEGNTHSLYSQTDGSTLLIETTPTGWIADLHEFPLTRVTAMEVEPSGRVHLVGTTAWTGFPTRNSAARCGSGDGAFLLSLDSNGRIEQATYLRERPQALAALNGSALVLVGAGPGQSRSLFRFTPSASNQPAPACLVNAGSFAVSNVAPGQIMTIFGSNLVVRPPAIAEPANNRFPFELAGTRITVGGIPAPMLYSSSDQINFVVPWSIATNTQSLEICVSTPTTSRCLPSTPTPVAPGIFGILNQDGSVNSQQAPAAVGSIVSVYTTGLGPIGDLPPDGTITVLLSGRNLLHNVTADFVTPATCVAGVCEPGVPAEVLYAGPAPGLITGAQQVNLRVSAATTLVRVCTVNGAAGACATYKIWVAP